MDNEAWLRNIGAVLLDDEDTAAAEADDDDDSNDDDAVGLDDDASSDGEDTDPLDGEGGDSDAADVVDDGERDQPDDHDEDESDPPKQRRFTPWVVAAFGGAAAVAVIASVVVSVVNSPGSQRATVTGSSAAPVRVIEAVPPSPAATVDDALPFTVSAEAPTGSTAVQSVADPNSTTPWICVRSVDGQVLEIDLGRSYMITAVSIVPGAVVKAPGDNQPDPWLQHRVVTRLQWQFNDTQHTMQPQNTGNVRGEAVEAIQPPVLASKITVIIQETSRPPMVAPSSPQSTAPGEPTIFGDILGGGRQVPEAPVSLLPSQEDSANDPVDGTFAISSIKIIGHKAS